MFGFELDSDTQLKILEKQQAAEIFALADRNREHLREWLPWVDRTLSVSDTEKFIETTRHQFARNEGFQASVWYQGNIAGCVGFHGVHWSNSVASLGYWLDRELQGRGIMTLACRALIDHAFGEYGLNRIEIRCAVENWKSRHIPERLGFTLEGRIRQASRVASGQFVDQAVYGLLASEWQKTL